MTTPMIARIAILSTVLAASLVFAAASADALPAPRFHVDDTLVVHAAPGNPDGGTGSWAWTYLGYHPDGWQIYADAPSHAANVLRNLAVDDVVYFSGMVCGAFRVTQVNPVLLPGDGPAESDAVIHLTLPNGWRTLVAEFVMPC